MGSSFRIVSRPGKKISLETSKHACPKCKHQASVQLMRSEKRVVVFTKCIYNVMRVRYECSNCKWKNGELPIEQQELYYEDILVSNNDILNSLDRRSVMYSY